MSKVHKTEPKAPPRGLARRHGFLEALSRMPYFETWDSGEAVLPEGFTEDEAVPIIIRQHHVKLIPRRVRRDMAKKLAKRGFQAMRGL